MDSGWSMNNGNVAFVDFAGEEESETWKRKRVIVSAGLAFPRLRRCSESSESPTGRSGVTVH